VLDLYRLRERDLAAAANSSSPLHGLRERKGWGDRSVNHLLAAVDHARTLDDHRCTIELSVVAHQAFLARFEA
jgi:hypothetical protein